MTLETQKKAARAAAFAQRKLAFEAQNGTASGLLSEILAGYRGAALAGFMPINTEIDPRPAMAEASAHGAVGVPVITASATPLEFARWSPGVVMVEGAFKAHIPADIEWMRFKTTHFLENPKSIKVLKILYINFVECFDF